MTATAIFIMTYVGVPLGRIPGLVIDRVGIALLGAIGMVVCGVLSVENAIRSIDLPTILLNTADPAAAPDRYPAAFYSAATGKRTHLVREAVRGFSAKQEANARSRRRHRGTVA